ncbi:MAG: hypothetical protein OEV66_07140 [Spirochaetia bacterium]|nr:hypothetical protein [Spirochaetia bacterium]
MIVHRYIPYDGSENPFDPNELMAKVGELMMRYQVSLDEALQLLLANGQIPNIHLKQAGLTDFIEEMIRQLEEQKGEILKKYDPQKNLSDANKDISTFKGYLKKTLNKETFKEFETGGISSVPDYLYRLRWNMLIHPGREKRNIEKMDRLLSAMEILGNLEKSLRLFDFSGKNKIPGEIINEELKKLFNLEDTINALKEALANGDFQTLSLDKLRQAIGMEKLQEFLELQRKLLDQMREILEKKGFIEAIPGDSAEATISAKAIDYISSHALNELYSHLQNDSAGLSLVETEGDSEHTTSRLRNFEFGDNISSIDWSATLVNAYIQKRRAPVLQDIEV